MTDEKIEMMTLEDVLQYAFSKDVEINLHLTKECVRREDDGRFECKTILYACTNKKANKLPCKSMSFGNIAMPKLYNLKKALIESVDSVTCNVETYNNKIRTYYN